MGHLAEDLGDGLGRAGALKLAALLHDVAKPETRTEVDGRVRFIGHDVIGAERARGIAGRLRLSGRATGVLGRLVAQHLRPMHLAQAGRITRRARYRFFRDLGEDARDLLLLALADAAGVDGAPPLEVWAGAGGAVLRSLMEGAAEASAVAATPALLDGDDVMAAVGIGPGPDGRPAPRGPAGGTGPRAHQNAGGGARAPCVAPPARRLTLRATAPIESQGTFRLLASFTRRAAPGRNTNSQGGLDGLPTTAHRCDRALARGRPRRGRARRARSSSPRAWTRPRSTP